MTMFDAQRQQTIAAARRYTELSQQRDLVRAEVARLEPLVARHAALVEQLGWINAQAVDAAQVAADASELLVAVSKPGAGVPR